MKWPANYRSYRLRWPTNSTARPSSLHWRRSARCFALRWSCFTSMTTRTRKLPRFLAYPWAPSNHASPAARASFTNFSPTTRGQQSQEPRSRMDREQAREILLRYRPGTDATIDPQVVEALRLLDQDAELARWFAQQQQADKAIRARLRETPVPADLKQRILAEQKIVRVDFGWRRRMLTAAAAIVVLAAIAEWAILRPRINDAFSAYQKYAVAYVSDRYVVSLKASNFDELRQVLAQRKWPTDFIVPESLRTATVVGGGAFEWNGHKVALACM